jgi:hypothetical protein
VTRDRVFARPKYRLAPFAMKPSKMVRRRRLSVVTSGTNGKLENVVTPDFAKTRDFRCFRKVQGEQEVHVRAKDVATCPECSEVIEEGQERTIISGKEYHKWCHQKKVGDKGPSVRKVDIATCPECSEAIEEGQERTIISGKEYHKWCHQKKVGDKGPAVRKVSLKQQEDFSKSRFCKKGSSHYLSGV